MLSSALKTSFHASVGRNADWNNLKKPASEVGIETGFHAGVRRNADGNNL